jgi:hypothetical protein
MTPASTAQSGKMSRNIKYVRQPYLRFNQLIIGPKNIVGEYQTSPSHRTDASGLFASPRSMTNGRKTSPIARRMSPTSFTGAARTRSTSTPSSFSIDQVLGRSLLGTITVGVWPLSASSIAKSRIWMAHDIRDGGYASTMSRTRIHLSQNPYASRAILAPFRSW